MREPLSKVGIIKHTTEVQCVDSLFIISGTLEKLLSSAVILWVNIELLLIAHAALLLKKY